VLLAVSMGGIVPKGCINGPRSMDLLVTATHGPDRFESMAHLLATNVAFVVVFGVFVVAFVALSTFIAVWSFRRAAQNRRDWADAKLDETPDNDSRKGRA